MGGGNEGCSALLRLMDWHDVGEANHLSPVGGAAVASPEGEPWGEPALQPVGDGGA